MTIFPRSGLTLRESISPASSRLNVGAGSSLSSPNTRAEPPVRLALSRKTAERDEKGTEETENGDVLFNNADLPTVASQPQSLAGSQKPPDRASSTASNRPLESTTATTDPLSLGTSAAAETISTSTTSTSMSDWQGQRQALSRRDGRLQSRECVLAEDETDSTERSTEVEVVSPDKGPTTGGVPIFIIGDNFPSIQLYVRFGDSITRTVSGFGFAWRSRTHSTLPLDATE
jgi:hypothetical protein